MHTHHRSDRTSDRLSGLGDRLGQARLLLLGALLIGLPFGLGGRANWVLPTTGLVNALAVALLALELACSRQRRLRLHVAWLVAGLLLAVLCLQLWPAAGLVSALSPQAAALWQRARDAGFTDLASCLSLAPARTRIALLLLAQIGLTGWLVYNTFTTPRRLLLLSACVSTAALANALAGFAPTFLGGASLYASLGVTAHPLSGTFLNRNHFGCLLGLGLIQLAGLAWAVFRARDTRPRSNGYRERSLEQQLDRWRGPILLLLALAAVPVGMGLVFSLSRGAAMGVTAGLLVFIGLGSRGGSSTTRRTLWIVTSLLVGAILLGAIEALTDLWNRYESLVTLGNIGLDGRTTVWRETLELLRRFPWCGIGLDAFERVSPLVESGFAAGKISFHAHNDYLELLAEVGLPLGILCLLLVLTAMAYGLRRVLRCRNPLCRTLGLAAWCGLLALALHEGVDYSLRAPANAFVAAALAVLCLLASEQGEKRAKRTRKAVAQAQPEAGHGGPRPEGGPEVTGQGDPPQRTDGARPQTGRRAGARLGLAAAAVAVSGAALWVYPPQIRAGARLMSLRAITGATPEQANTGAARKTQATYCIDRARAILHDLPDHEQALYYQAAYTEALATRISSELAGQQITPEQHAQAKAAVIAARGAARQLCQQLPVAGYYQALYAKELNRSAWYDASVAIPAVVRAFETAHANHPNVPQVTWLCLQAFSEILAVDRDELSATDLDRLGGLFAAMGTALLEQQPDRSADVLESLQRVFPDPEKLIAIVPPRLLCLEPLYDRLFRQGRYEHCAALIETMERVNRERFTRQDSEDITPYELTRTHPQSRAEVTVQLARRRLTLASARGAGELYAELRQSEAEARQALCRPLTAAALQAAAAGDYYRALRQGRVLVARFPEIPETQALLAGWLLTVGERQKALESLEALLGMPELPAAVCAQGLAVADRLLSERGGRDEVALVADVLRVRQAQSAGAAGGGDLAAVRERLVAWATGPGQVAAIARFGHLALFSAGCAAELAGDLRGAADLYQQALALCPLHRPSVERLMALPAGVAVKEQEGVRAQLEAAGIRDADLHRDLIVPVVGVALRRLTVEPAVIDPTQAVTVSVAVEITAELAVLPALRLTFGCADGSSFVIGIADKQWSGVSEVPRLGQLLVAKRELVPAIASLQAEHALPDGPVTLRIQGAGRDAGSTFYHPAFTVRRPPPRP
jgi:O-antigen ligase